MKAVKCENLTKKYNDKIAVDNLSLEIDEGQIFTLLGVNGAGKSTTIKMLCSLTKPTSGSACIFSESIENPNSKKYIAVSPQETAVAKNLTVYENLLFMARIYFDKKTAKKKTDAIVSDFFLSEVKNQRPKTLSGGWQRRLSIAMAVICEPKLLFLDEPTLGLDVIAMHKLWETILNLKEKMTIFLTTHNMREAQALSDRVAILSKGKLVDCCTINELLKKTETDSLEDAFLALCGQGTGGVSK